MTDIPPIPKELLIHSVAYHEYDPGNSWGESYKAPVFLERVRVEPSDKVVRGAAGDSVISVATLYVDSVNSGPTPLPAFSLKSKVVFGGREMFIVSPDPLFALDPVTPHHWEITLE